MREGWDISQFHRTCVNRLDLVSIFYNVKISKYFIVFEKKISLKYSVKIFLVLETDSLLYFPCPKKSKIKFKLTKSNFRQLVKTKVKKLSYSESSILRRSNQFSKKKIQKKTKNRKKKV